MKNIEIIPAILPTDFEDLTDKLSYVVGNAKNVQIDVCDGQFTSSPSWPYRKQDDSFVKLVAQEEGLPGWEKLDFEVDMMVNRPEAHVQEWISAGASRIIFHIEVKGDILEAIKLIGGQLEIGMAINIDTDIESLAPYIDSIQFIQCMGIARIGFQGQPFDERVIEKIKSLRLKYPQLPISVDGGVTLDTAQELIAAGATRLVVGSAIFDSDNIVEAIHAFKVL